MLSLFRNRFQKYCGLLAILFFWSVSLQAQDSLSDLSLSAWDEIKKEKAEVRDPFSPVSTEGLADPTTLNLSGIIVGENKRLAVISGRIVRPGDKIGAFEIKKIDADGVLISWDEGVTRLIIENYVHKSIQNEKNYEISFYQADIKQALRLISTTGNYNVIMPENLEGRVSLSFHQTTLKDALGAILRVNQLAYAEENGIFRIGKASDFSAGSYFQSRYYTLKYATASDLLDTIKSQLSKDGNITADERTNTLIIKDNEATLDSVFKLIATLDKADTQVRIEAKIVGVTRNFARSLGIQWGISKSTGTVQGFGSPTSGASGLTGNPINVSAPATGALTGGAGLILNNVGNDINLDVEITAAETRGDAKVISQPTITTLNNTPALIRSGVKLFVKTTSSISVGGDGGSATGSQSGLEEIDTGITLSVTPQISVDNKVKLKIDAEESTANFGATVDGIPSVRDNTASTTVLIQNGATTVIGGLMKVDQSNEKSGIPFISSIPFFGWFFKNKSKRREDTELLIFITPYIVGSKIPKKETVVQTTTDEEAIIERKSKKKKNNLRRSRFAR